MASAKFLALNSLLPLSLKNVAPPVCMLLLLVCWVEELSETKIWYPSAQQQNIMSRCAQNFESAHNCWQYFVWKNIWRSKSSLKIIAFATAQNLQDWHCKFISMCVFYLQFTKFTTHRLCFTINFTVVDKKHKNQRVDLRLKTQATTKKNVETYVFLTCWKKILIQL